MDKNNIIKPGMYERIFVVPDDRLIVVDDYGTYLPEEDFAEFEPDLRCISYWGLDTAELEFHTHERFNETIDDIDFLAPLIEKHRIEKDIIETRKVDPLYKLEGEERKAKQKEVDKNKVLDDYVKEVNKSVEVVVPEGTFSFKANQSKILNMFLWTEAAQALLEPTIDFYDDGDNRVTLSVASAKRVVANLIKANRTAVHNKVNKDKEIEERT